MSKAKGAKAPANRADPVPAGAPSSSKTLGTLSQTMLEIESEREAGPAIIAVVQHILDRIQESHRALRESGGQKLKRTTVKLAEVSSATESAAMDIMDGVGRAMEFVDRLEMEQAPSEASMGLRDELFEIMNHLQFQDITTQQIQYTSSLLEEIEAELLDFVDKLDVDGGAKGNPRSDRDAWSSTFDPFASMRDAEGRQATADELLRNRETSEVVDVPG